MSGGPRGRAHDLEVAEIIRETADSVSLVLDVPEAAAHRFRYHPGQFLTLRVPGDEPGSAVARCYSMSSSPHLDDDLILTVKRVPGGRASSWLCDEVRVGDRLTVLTPSGSFFPRTFDEDFLLVGAGSGITPLMSIATSALMGGVRDVRLFYANRDPGSVIFVDEIAELRAEFGDRFTVEHWHESERGLPSPDALVDELAAHAGHRIWVCGPAPFMAIVEKAAEAVGVPSDRVHTERYRSLTGDPFADVDVTVVNTDDDARVSVTLRGDTVDLAWPRSATLLDVLLAAGHDAPFSCREGECSSCACRVVSGDVTMRKNDTLVDSDIAMGLTLACQAIPRSEEITVTFDT